MTEAQDNPITPSDEDFDDGLDFPHQVTIISVEGEPVAVERNDEGDGLASGDCYLYKLDFMSLHLSNLKCNVFDSSLLTWHCIRDTFFYMTN